MLKETLQMTITADSKLPLVSLSELSVEHAPIIDIQGWKLTPEAKVHWLQNTQAQRTGTLGKVVDIIETYETIRIWSDESTSGTVMRALVWDDNANKPMYVQIGYRSEYNQWGERYTVWEVDANAETRAKYLAWQTMNTLVGDLSKRVQSLTDARTQYEVLTKGHVAKVVRGRKYPKGITGKVTWIGQNKFGVVAMLATSDRKVGNRHADVIFITLDNLERVLTEDEQKSLNDLNDEIETCETAIRKAKALI